MNELRFKNPRMRLEQEQRVELVVDGKRYDLSMPEPNVSFVSTAVENGELVARFTVKVGWFALAWWWAKTVTHVARAHGESVLRPRWLAIVVRGLIA